MIKTKKCIICETIFEFRRPAGRSRLANQLPIRMKTSLTCSPKCSKIYNRVQNYVRQRLKNHIAARR